MDYSDTVLIGAPVWLGKVNSAQEIRAWFGRKQTFGVEAAVT